MQTVLVSHFWDIEMDFGIPKKQTNKIKKGKFFHQRFSLSRVIRPLFIFSPASYMSNKIETKKKVNIHDTHIYVCVTTVKIANQANNLMWHTNEKCQHWLVNAWNVCVFIYLCFFFDFFVFSFLFPSVLLFLSLNLSISRIHISHILGSARHGFWLSFLFFFFEFFIITDLGYGLWKSK